MVKYLSLFVFIAKDTEVYPHPSQPGSIDDSGTVSIIKRKKEEKLLVEILTIFFSTLLLGYGT